MKKPTYVLLPCPCCGGEARMVRPCFVEFQRPQWRVYCIKCQLRQNRYPTGVAAAKAWNKRVPLK